MTLLYKPNSILSGRALPRINSPECKTAVYQGRST